MKTASAILSHVLAAGAVVVACVGLWATTVTEGRLWGPEVAHISQDGRVLIVPFLVVPHVLGVVAAIPARRFVSCAAFVFVGASIAAWLSVALMNNERLNRAELVLGLLQQWILQFLVVCTLVIPGGIVGWQEGRKLRKAASQIPPSEPEA